MTRSPLSGIFLALLGFYGSYLIYTSNRTIVPPPCSIKAPVIFSVTGAAFYEKLLPLYRVKKPPSPIDWLANQPEPGQTFAEFMAGHDQRPDLQRRIIYLALLGEFDGTQKRIVVQTAQFLSAFFGLPVKFLNLIPAAAVPANARRTHPQTGDQQVLTRYVLDEVLKPARPADAFCLMAFTASDLWPGEGWNFVFGEASLPERVAVWSIYRNGDPHLSPEQYRLCLLRTLKTGTHEVGHMLGMWHCIYYECALNGSNHRRESDERPLELCPVCLRKLIWATGTDPITRYSRLRDLCRQFGLDREAGFYQRSLQLLEL